MLHRQNAVTFYRTSAVEYLLCCKPNQHPLMSEPFDPDRCSNDLNTGVTVFADGSSGTLGRACFAMSELGIGPEQAPLNNNGRVQSVHLGASTIAR